MLAAAPGSRGSSGGTSPWLSVAAIDATVVSGAAERSADGGCIPPAVGFGRARRASVIAATTAPVSVAPMATVVMRPGRPGMGTAVPTRVGLGPGSSARATCGGTGVWAICTVAAFPVAGSAVLTRTHGISGTLDCTGRPSIICRRSERISPARSGDSGRRAVCEGHGRTPIRAAGRRSGRGSTASAARR